jgi:hypothetical protein
MRALLCFALVAGGCVLKNDARYCDSTTFCNDPAFPNCDLVRHECESGGVPDGGGDDMSVASCTDSSTCPADMPVCTDGACGPCNGDGTTCSMFHASTPLCALSGGCVQCLANMDCFSLTATPYCGPANSCVECLTAANCSPQVCSATNMCRGCQTNAECPSGICDVPSGNCVAPSMIALVDNGGMTVAACNTARPTQNGQGPTTAYCDISGAGATKPYVLVTGHGAGFPYGPFTVGGPVVYVGPGYKAAMPAVITGAPAGIGMVTISDIASVTVDGFEIDGANAKDGIDCTSTKSAAPHNVLIVKNSYIHNTSGNAGIYPKGCDLVVDGSRVAAASIRDIDDTFSQFGTNTTLTNSQFDSATADGVDVNAGGTTGLTMDRCLVINNSAANGNGLQINGPNFSVTNTFFYSNSQAVSFVFTPAATSVFMFNTVAYNTLGISCGQTVIQASIYVHNGDGPIMNGTGPGTCKLLDVVTDAPSTPQPVFVDVTSPTTYDFRLATDTQAHLTANQACCIDKVGGPLDGGTSPVPNHDFFGTLRPLGAGYDIGAHEAR